MSVITRARTLLAAGSATVLFAGFAVLGASPASAITHPPLTLDKTVAHSGADHGDSISVSGASCGEGVGNSITIYLATGVVGDDQPLSTALTGASNGALPNGSGDWTGALSIPGGSGLQLASGQYTVRAGCYNGVSDNIDGAAMVYAGVVIVINDGEVVGTTTTTVAGNTTTTAQAAGTNAVSTDPAFTG